MRTQSMGKDKKASVGFSFKIGCICAGIIPWEEGSDIFTLQQVHSNEVYVLTEFTPKSPEADAVITQLRGIKVGVKTADCVPVALLGQKTVGVVHAGWKGLKAGIIEETLKIFEQFEPINSVIAFVGPSAKACCYQVGEDFKKSFIATYYRNGSLFLDTQEEAILRLKRCGVKKLVKLNVCTICHTNWPSHRRDKTKDRIITYAYIE